MPGNAAAVEGKDFVPIKDQLITFKAGVVSHRIELELPDCDLQADDENQQDTVSFALILENPLPEGNKLLKKSTCFINIEAVDLAAQEREDFERRKMIDFFTAENDPTWGE